jgi:hypothetical protein
MEYLTTYGWAVLVIAIVLAVLVYLGVFNPFSRVPDRCVFQQGVGCASAKLISGTTGSLQIGELKLVNRLPKPIGICAMYCTHDSDPPQTTYATADNCKTIVLNLGERTEPGGTWSLERNALGNVENLGYWFGSPGYCRDGGQIAKAKAGDGERVNAFIYYMQEGDTAVRMTSGEIISTVQQG